MPLNIELPEEFRNSEDKIRQYPYFIYSLKQVIIYNKLAVSLLYILVALYYIVANERMLETKQGGLDVNTGS